MKTYKAVLHKSYNDSAPFWEGCNREEFLLQVCNNCKHCYYYPRLACPKCSSLDVGWRRSSGHGKIYSYTHVHVSFMGDYWESELPYTTILVDLDEGVRLVSRLIGDDRDKVQINDEVEIEWVRAKEAEQKLPFFRRTVLSSRPDS